MTLVRTRPMRGQPYPRDLFDSFDRLVEGLGRTGPMDLGETGGYPLDLYETDDALVLEMAVPGLDPEDLDLSLEGRQLTLRGTVAESEGEDRRYWLQGVPRGSFTRSLALPVNVDAETIDARVRHGMLVLTMPKAQEAKVRKIAVRND